MNRKMHSINRFWRRPAAESSQGSALVELALVLPMLVILIIGAAELGRLAYAAIEVGNAARAGLSYAAQNHATASDPTGIAASAKSDSPNFAVITVSSGPCMCPATSATSAAPACNKTFFTNAVSFTCPSAISSPTEFVQVDITGTVSTFLYYPGFPSSYKLNSSGTMVVEQ